MRLIVSDMDGTLLDGTGAVPQSLWPVLSKLRDNGIVFAVASGRQHPTLQEYFQPASAGIAYIAENGAYVICEDEVISTSPLGLDAAQQAVRSIRGIATTRDLGAVWCSRDTAYIERADSTFRREVDAFYKHLMVVDDLLALDDEALKIAVYDFDDPESGSGPILREVTPLRIVMSAPHWIDIMNPNANKGTALRDLQSALRVTPDETMVFGDYPNDLEMMDAATHSFAMANAHPEVSQRAAHQAPSNEDAGVITILEELARWL